ncbi:hypothetical protein SRRS_24720 [Sporomusa rhizae]|uniref:2-hydroxymuconate tautomerase n=1 Tax=Sporomusa rhizae TaxID=357999 RepID=UPI00352B8CED
MPIVQIDLLEGRSQEQKQEMVKRVTEVIVETAKCPPEAVTIIVRESPVAKAGVFLSSKK